MNHELRTKLRISEAKNSNSAQLYYQELQDHVRKNLDLSNVIEEYEKEILKYKGEITHRSVHSVQSKYTSANIQELIRWDAESDIRLNECRRRSSGISGSCMNSYITPNSCRLYPDRMDCSFNSKASRLDINPLASFIEVSKLSPVKSETCHSSFDSEVKEREITTIKEKSKRFWEEFDSVCKRK